MNEKNLELYEEAMRILRKINDAIGDESNFKAVGIATQLISSTCAADLKMPLSDYLESCEVSFLQQNKLLEDFQQ